MDCNMIVTNPKQDVNINAVFSMHKQRDPAAAAGSLMPVSELLFFQFSRTSEAAIHPQTPSTQTWYQG